MTVIPGVEVQQDAEGVATRISIDLRENPDAIPLLKEAGLMPKTNKELEEEFDNGLTIKEVFDEVRQVIRNHYAKRNHHTTGKR